MRLGMAPHTQAKGASAAEDRRRRVVRPRISTAKWTKVATVIRQPRASVSPMQYSPDDHPGEDVDHEPFQVATRARSATRSSFGRVAATVRFTRSAGRVSRVATRKRDPLPPAMGREVHSIRAGKGPGGVRRSRLAGGVRFEGCALAGATSTPRRRLVSPGGGGAAAGSRATVLRLAVAGGPGRGSGESPSRRSSVASCRTSRQSLRSCGRSTPCSPGSGTGGMSSEPRPSSCGEDRA